MQDLKKYKLLVVDDDDELRDIIVDIFERHGFTVLSANSGTAAFLIVKQQPIDLIISDMRMADGDGMMLLEKVRAYDPDIPVVIFITGFSNFSKEECIRKGAKDVVNKPFDSKELVKSVKDSLGIKLE